MGIGASVRRAFGPHERQVAAAYRGIYVDVAQLGSVIAAHVPKANRILEVGGGEGAVTEALAQKFPVAQILSIDITDRIGRLYSGPQDRVEFRQADISEIATSHGAQFDLVVISDVLHHVPPPQRMAFLQEVARTLAPEGRLVIKDWERTATPIHWLCYASDRWLTGDRVAFLTPDETRNLVMQAIPQLSCETEGTIAPWRNNYIQVFRWSPRN
jgi:2-polyprenyl-3-methyl-5-hydroxy-6-metoxy-1,4-benzoquinol methylase